MRALHYALLRLQMSKILRTSLARRLLQVPVTNMACVISGTADWLVAVGVGTTKKLRPYRRALSIIGLFPRFYFEVNSTLTTLLDEDQQYTTPPQSLVLF